MRVNVEKVLERDQKLSELDSRAGLCLNFSFSEEISFSEDCSFLIQDSALILTTPFVFASISFTL